MARTLLDMQRENSKETEKKKLKYIQIITYLKKGIKDIEGDAILQKLHTTGYEVHGVKVGQAFFLEVKDDVDIDKVCKDVLVNDLLYDYVVTERNPVN
jgi:phosphoribosylformylglycinamidine (FGAM) synthase PurS component